jgi:pimeloyl-ACP methyl ester carboxylesterase
MRIETLVEDAAAWVKFLRADKRFTGVGLIGQSEGSLIGILAGQKEKVDAFVSLCGSGRRFSDLIREQLKGQLTKEQAEKSDTILRALEAGKTVDDVPKEVTAVSKQVADLYRPSVQPYLISVFKYDPAAEVGKLGCPVLVVTGTTDFQIPAADGERLAAGARGARHVAIKNMCHVLKQADNPNRVVQALTVYADPKFPLHPELAPELGAFLKGALGVGK